LREHLHFTPDLELTAMLITGSLINCSNRQKLHTHSHTHMRCDMNIMCIHTYCTRHTDTPRKRVQFWWPDHKPML